MKFTLTLLTILLSSTFSFSQDNYKEFLQGEFEYCNPEHTASITIKKTKVVEKYKSTNGQKIKIVATMQWLSENSYRLTAETVKGTKLFAKGDYFIITITGIKNNEMSYSYILSTGIESTDCFRKVQDK